MTFWPRWARRRCHGHAAAARSGETLSASKREGPAGVFHTGHIEPSDDGSVVALTQWAAALGEYAQRNRGHRLDVLILVGSGHIEDHAVEACITKRL